MTGHDDYVHTPFGLYPGVDAQSFEDGEQVALVSGGPAMTVIGRAKGAVLVAWFGDGDDRMQHALLPAAALFSLEDDDFEDTIGVCSGSC